ncbi:unnamed protein product [Candida verbasci]|uniref:Uncharacterized protein n=1 Tax=Candida verbasci TaxID=1227364 RepID=A0A9W4XMR0_9ASCO|nr:unnamed protein product [Candida verbasci]
MARQNFVGLVVSQGKMSKTVKVRISNKVYDNRIDKEIVKRKDYLVHDEGNVCKEGDIVRIESIPKISKRKYFAIAEFKQNKGQQFAQYEDLAKSRIKEEQQLFLESFKNHKMEFNKIITQISDMKKLDELSYKLRNGINDDSVNDEVLINEINDIKAKYNINSWPTTESTLELEVNKPVYTNEEEKRVFFMDFILEQLNNEKFQQYKSNILGGNVDKKKNIQKNLMRTWILNVNNELPFKLPE